MTIHDNHRQNPEPMIIGVLADPVAAPSEVAQHLEQELPGLLFEQLPDREWKIDVCRERLPPSDMRDAEMLNLATERKRQRSWHFAVCITDLPLIADGHAVAADASSSRNVAVVSLPAFGAMALRRRVRQVTAQLIIDLYCKGTPHEDSEEHRQRRIAALSGALRRITPDDDGIDLRILASRSRLRLLIGMVRDNRPWRLVSGLRGALVGAFAFSAFYLINTTLWELALTTSVWQRVATVIASITVMLTWLIVYHHLWERKTHLPPQERELTGLYNASTVITLTIGLGFGYLALFVLNLIATFLVFTPEVFRQYAGPEPGLAEHLIVALITTAAATVAGAIGSGFESEESVREAAYSFRERERRQALQRSRAAEPDDETLTQTARDA